MGAGVEYLTIDEVRLEFGSEVEDDSDASIQWRIDSLSAYLEDQLGHAFCRALVVNSTGADTVTVTTTAVVLTGVTYAFADYPTLQDLVTAVTADGSIDIELLPMVRPDTPSSLLAARAVANCGPTRDVRQVLDLSARYEVLTGSWQSHIFLRLPVATVSAVTQNGETLATTDYWLQMGKPWLVRRSCACITSCSCPYGQWSGRYPDNIAVTYIPLWFARPPSVLRGVLLQAYGTRHAVGPSNLQSESFGEYSYRRATEKVANWQDTLSDRTVARYAVQFHP